MADSSLVNKLRLKAGQRAALIHAPKGYREALAPLPEGVQFSEKLEGTFDWLQIFVKNQAELEGIVSQVLASLKPTSLLWISFPKGTSKIQTDLTRDVGWDSLQPAGLKWTNLISVDETWSAFSMRPYKPGEARHSFR
jgi:hypothetical protein